MKKFVVFFRDLELGVYAGTQKEARRIAIAGFMSHVENELIVCEAAARTERCDICQYTYEPCWIAQREGEQLCEWCYFDKYRFEEQNLNDIDIPF